MKNLTYEQASEQLTKLGVDHKYFELPYWSRSASNGAMCLLGEVTCVQIHTAYDDGTCYLSVTDGWTEKLLTDRILLKDAANVANKLLNKGI